jgi:2-polyprenyl-3-methyl-5-hydroxy-6-metoxy-1,4-benzoquinol methylase
MSSLDRAITEDYYRTTATRTHARSQAYYDDTATQLLRRIGKLLPTDHRARCLDLACGCGETIYALEREGFADTHGVDLSKQEVEEAAHFVKGRVDCDDALAYLRRLPPASVDFVTALNFLEHLEKDALHDMLREIRRVLAPGGRLVAMVPNAQSTHGSLTRYWDMTHHWAFTPNNFRQLAVLTGFEPEPRFHECGPVPHGVVSAARWLAWQGIRAATALRLLIEVATTKDGVYTMDMIVEMQAPP